MKQWGESTDAALPESQTGPTFPGTESPPHREEVDSKLEQAREHLLTLRRQQEDLEHQKNDLEELRRKQDEYSRGRAEMIDNLTRALVSLERQQIESQRLAELCGKTTDDFSRLHRTDSANQ